MSSQADGESRRIGGLIGRRGGARSRTAESQQIRDSGGLADICISVYHNLIIVVIIIIMMIMIMIIYSYCNREFTEPSEASLERAAALRKEAVSIDLKQQVLDRFLGRFRLSEAYSECTG